MDRLILLCSVIVNNLNLKTLKELFNSDLGVSGDSTEQGLITKNLTTFITNLGLAIDYQPSINNFVDENGEMKILKEIIVDAFTNLYNKKHLRN